jgi:serine/threonine-protein kinase
MTPDRWRQVSGIFDAALARDAGAREAYLAEACLDDAALRAEVDKLLAAHRDADAGSFGEAPLGPQRVPRLESGTFLGAYRIEALIDAGGMGEVYRAHDPRLGRDVAVKVLPPEAADAERQRRFAREAQIIASLNHPNIVTLHSVEESGGHHFLTMELVEGQTLRELTPPDGLPVARLLDIAIPLADAVGAAHARGVIHRDLKPGNVMVTPDGRVKVLDFGLAKLTASRALEAESGIAAAHEITADLRILGTAAYMSPEQAQGYEVDHRTDIFSLGVMLYELATGQRPFAGESTVLMLSSIVKDTPSSVTDLKPELPRELGRLIRRCLAKDPNRRFQSAHDLRNELEEIKEDLEAGTTEVGPRATVHAARPRLNRRLNLVAASLVLSAIAGGYVVWTRQGDTGGLDPLRLTMQPPPGTRLTEPMAAPWMAISPDGKWIAFPGLSDDPNRSGLYLRSVNHAEPKLIAKGPSATFTPFFSPDSQWLGFWANQKIWKVQVTGGEPVSICAAGNTPGPTWGDDGTILFMNRNAPYAIWRVSDRGGQPVVQLRSPADERHFPQQVLPGSEAALITVSAGVGDSRQSVAVLSLKTGKIRKLLFGSTPRYVRPGFLIFRYLDAIHAAPFDLSRLEVTGESRSVLPDVNYYPFSGSSGFDVSREGALIYTPGAPRVENSELVWLDRQGRIEPAAAERQPYSNAELDGEGRRVAVHVESSLQNRDLFVFDIERANWARLTQGLDTVGTIAWSPDGQWIIFSSKRSGIPKLFRIRATGGTAEPLTDGPDLEYAANIHGNAVVFTRQEWSRGGRLFLWRMTFDPPGAPERVTQFDFVLGPKRISPGGKWIAYSSDVFGRREVYVAPFRGPTESYRDYVVAPGAGARWSRDGRSLFFVRKGEIWVAPVLSDPGSNDFQAGTPELVVRHDLLGPPDRDAEPTLDGQRFLVVRRPAPDKKVLVYVPNWLDDVKRR